jgi:hypothetical protein
LFPQKAINYRYDDFGKAVRARPERSQGAVKPHTMDIVMMFEAIIFDSNGVLWWDGHLQDQAWKQFSAEKRGTPFSA